MTRAPGRHAIGAPYSEVAPRIWDPAKKAAAAQLDMLEPTWVVLYGPASRRFFAFAMWHVAPLRVEATTIEELRHLMREAECDAITSQGGHRASVA